MKIPHKYLTPLLLILVFSFSFVQAQSNCGSNMDYVGFYRQGINEYTQGSYQEALESFSCSISQFQFSGAYDGRARARRELGQYELAIADLTTAIQIDPSQALLYEDRGYTYQLAGNYSAALVDLTRAIELGQTDSLLFVDRASAYIELGDYPEAIADLEHAQEIDPSSAQPYIYLGHTYSKMGDLTAALTNYTRAIELDPTNSRAYSNRGVVYLNQDEYDLAFSDFTRAIELGETDSLLFVHRASAYIELGDYPEAIADLEHAQEIDPSSAQPYISLGYAYFKMGDMTAALTNAARAIELDPTNSRAYSNRGVVYLNQDEYGLAFSDFTRAIELDSTNEHGYLGLGDVSFDTLDYESARVNYSRYLSLTGENAIPAIRSRMQALQSFGGVNDEVNGTVQFVIVNESNATICYVESYPVEVDFFDEGRQDQWSGNMLDPGETIAPGAFRSWQIQLGHHYLEMSSCTGEVLFLAETYNIGGPTIQSLSQGTVDRNHAVGLDLTATETRRNESVFEDEDDVLLNDVAFEDALKSYEEALSIDKRLNNPSDEASTLQSLGTLYLSRGDYGSALEYFGKALALKQQLGDHSREISTLNNMAWAYFYQEQYGNALLFMERALATARSVDRQHDEMLALRSIGTIYRIEGRFTEALKFYNEALDVADSSDDEVNRGAIFNKIGVVYAEQEYYDKSLTYFSQALEIAQAYSDTGGEVRARHNIGTIKFLTGDYVSALDTFRQLLNNMAATPLNSIGQVYSAEGKYDQAINYFNQALAIRTDVTTLFNRGWANEQAGNTPQAIADYQASAVQVEDAVSGSAIDPAIASLVNQSQNRAPFQRLSILNAQQGNLSDALNATERLHAILTRSELSSDVIDFRASLDAPLLEEESKLHLALLDAQRFADSLSRDPNISNDSLQQAERKLEDARNAYEQQIETMQLQGGYLSRQVSFGTASLIEIQHSLPEDTTFIAYSIGSPNSLVLLITRSTIDSVILEVSEEELKNLVEVFAANRQTNTDVLTMLYRKLFAPIADKLHTSRLIIAPDGPLDHIPFAALQLPDGTYLIDKYAISMIPSGTVVVLLNNRQSAPASSPALVLAQPDGPGLPHLQFAQDEAIKVADILGVHPKLNATEADLRNEPPGYRILYMSVHAELDPFAPLFSNIYLGRDDTNDGRLEVREIYELDLRSTELVVLSGCDTASGGDGETYGVLIRAFLAAGA